MRTQAAAEPVRSPATEPLPNDPGPATSPPAPTGPTEHPPRPEHATSTATGARHPAPGPTGGGPGRPGEAGSGGGGIARRASADPLFRLVAYALESAHGRPPAAVWSAPYAFHLHSPGLVAAAGWPVAAAAAPRTDGLVRLSSLAHPADSCDVPLALTGPPPDTPAWAARPYALLRELARAGFGRGGTDLHVQGSLTPAAGLATAEPADCAVALAVVDVHTPAGDEPDRAHLALLLDRALPDGDGALRRAALFARPGEALLPGRDDARPPRYVAFDPAATRARLVLMAVRGRSGAADRQAELARAVACARRAGALSTWPPGPRPGSSVLVLLPETRLAAVRTAVAAEFRERGRPVPRFLNIAVAGPARREE
ncbi:galactokinase [Streptomyces sp. NPDC058619]|uniref:galactokinase n=1 Tax=unclassified Streptomyces TaxID=2593676 RepID=UPI003649A791